MNGRSTIIGGTVGISTSAEKCSTDQGSFDDLWRIWKARNMRVFEQNMVTPAEVLQEIKAEVQCSKIACGRDRSYLRLV